MNDKIKLIINLERSELLATALLVKRGEGIDYDKLMDVLNRVEVIDTANNLRVKEMLNNVKFVALINILALRALEDENDL